MSPVAIFIMAAIVLNVVTYGGITAVYLADKRRVDPPILRRDGREPERAATAIESSRHDLPHAA